MQARKDVWIALPRDKPMLLNQSIENRICINYAFKDVIKYSFYDFIVYSYNSSTLFFNTIK